MVEHAFDEATERSRVLGILSLVSALVVAAFVVVLAIAD